MFVTLEAKNEKKKHEEFSWAQTRKTEIESKLSNLPVEIKTSEIQKVENEIRDIEKDMAVTEREIFLRKQNSDEFKYLEAQYKREEQVIDSISHIKGFHGPLRQLGKIEDGYEAAVDAATSMMSSIVVDSTETAEEMIKIISSKNLNRTTFIILNRIQNAEIRGEYPDKLLFRKIKCKDIYTKCFYFALKDTLVADNLESARTMAFGKTRYRVVTIDGKLIEKSGIMSSGKKVKKGKPVFELTKALDKMKDLHNQKMNFVNENKKNVFKIRDLKDQLEKMNSILANRIPLPNQNNKKEEIELLKSKIMNLEKTIPENVASANCELTKFYKSLDSIKSDIQETKLQRRKLSLKKVDLGKLSKMTME